VARVLAGALACFLMMTGAFLLWQGHAQDSPALPPPPAKTPLPSIMHTGVLEAPVASEKSREEKRFDRADKDKDGKIMLAELLQPRQKAFAKLDTNRDGKLGFEEWAHTTIEKFRGADGDRNGQLTPAEYAKTAPPPPKPKPRCGC
jgi:hypothetical protein